MNRLFGCCERQIAPTADIAERHGVSEPAICIWVEKFGNLEIYYVKRLRLSDGEGSYFKNNPSKRIDSCCLNQLGWSAQIDW